MISWSKAQEVITQKAKLMPIIQQPLLKALGFVLAEDIIASSDLPPFDNSAMDGFAVQTSWLKDEGKSPLELPLAGAVFAGHKAEAMDENAAIAIMTGAKIPPFYDAVIPIENVTMGENSILITPPIHKGDNIRPQGSDIQKGEILIKKGTGLNAYHIGLLGAQGINAVSVYQKPKIAVMITGDEVGSQNEHSGQIADANGPFLTTAIAQLGCELVEVFHMNDNHEKLAEKLKNIQPYIDMIISTGAVSAGQKDFIPDFILAQKGIIHFHKIYQRPGKPLLFAELNDGTIWFGLPGNPVAVQASFDFSVKNWIDASQNKNINKKQYAIFKGHFAKKSSFRHFLRGFVYSDEQGQVIAELQNNQASYQLKNWGYANSWLIAPEGIEELNDGDIVEIVKV